jgi:hypothetical protein
MFTKQEVVEVFEVLARYREFMSKLNSFCLSVSELLACTGVCNIDIDESKVYFTAEWHGAYQAYDSWHHSFDIAMLEGKPEVVADLIRRAEEEKKAALVVEQQRQALEERKRKFEELRKEFGTD